jgi:hypothetical protein
VVERILDLATGETTMAEIDKKTHYHEDKVRRALNRQTLMSDEEAGVLGMGKCRARVRIYIGQGRMGGSFVQCSKKARPGKKTCWHHRHWEDEE